MWTKWFVIGLFKHSSLNIFRITFLFIIEIILISSIGKGNSLFIIEPGAALNFQDTVFIKKGRYLLLKNTFITIPRDTFYIIHQQKTGKSEERSIQHSQIFYDTVYKKLSRNKITQLLYYLAFVVPKQSDLPDTLQVLKSTQPFEIFDDKIIRTIDVKVLPPFGASVYDTGLYAVRGFGHTLNSVHMNTRKYVIRRNLLFKEGDQVNPTLLADNERLLRNISAIDNARIIVKQTIPESDSVDLIVVVKDVWSIGLDIPLITTKQVKFRPYDANFLGLGDQLSITLSMNLYQAPFSLFEGLSYTYSNIGGSLINATTGYTADRTGNRELLFHLDRSFLTNLTKWAGAVYTSWIIKVDEVADSLKITSHYNTEGIWLGRSFLLNRPKETSRGIISAGVYRKSFTSRPVVTIDSNRSYYNQIQFLTTYSFSRNEFYLTDYIRNFGKTENLPYGQLYQLTVGADKTDFYTRLYSGIHLSAGNYFDNFGYLSFYMKFGGFFNHSSFEDAVAKFNLNYFTPLLPDPDQRYKFRVFFSADYRYAFNSRPNNRDFYDANLDFRIDKVSNREYFNAVNIISARLSSVCFVPWYFYGFRFGIMMELQAGLIAHQNEKLYNAPLFSSIGLSLIIKNDNLIFPAFLISGYYYPVSVGNVRQLQFMLSSDLQVDYYDFNVTAPHEETLSN